MTGSYTRTTFKWPEKDEGGKNDWGIGSVPSLNLTVNIVSQSSLRTILCAHHAFQWGHKGNGRSSPVFGCDRSADANIFCTSLLLCRLCNKCGNFILFLWSNVELTHGFILAPFTSSSLFVYWLSSKMCISFEALTWGSHHNSPPPKKSLLIRSEESDGAKAEKSR